MPLRIVPAFFDDWVNSVDGGTFSVYDIVKIGVV